MVPSIIHLEFYYNIALSSTTEKDQKREPRQQVPEGS